MKLDFNLLNKNVIKPDICFRCGTCIGVCPTNAIELSTKKNIKYIELTGKCIKCGLCYKTCPAVEFTSTNKNQYYGDALSFYVSHSNEEEIRTKSASGGSLTSVLKYLLENKLIDAIGSLVPDDDNNHFSVKLIYNIDDLYKFPQSVYIIKPLNSLINKIVNSKIKVALTLLPCQMRGLKKYLDLFPENKKYFKYTFGLYCGNILQDTVLLSLKRRYKIKNKDNIKNLKFRDGEWPGNVKFDFNNKKFKINKFFFNYMIPFHISKGCLYCNDFFNEYCDISFGDGWKFENKDLKGWNAVIVHTKNGEQLYKELSEKNILTTESIESEDILKMHSHLLDFKKNGLFVRLFWRKLFYLKIPKYKNINKPDFKFKFFVIETIKYFIIWICHFKIFQIIADLIPEKIIGLFFVKLRKTLMNKSAKKMCKKI